MEKATGAHDVGLLVVGTGAGVLRDREPRSGLDVPCGLRINELGQTMTG